MRAQIAAALLLAASAANAVPQVWQNPTYEFSRPNDVNWTEPQYQDRITSNVWLTRGNFQGIFNIAQEGFYTGLSPADTEWAYGSAADWQSLTFQPWVLWHGSNPPSTVGQAAVVHLITDDIYIDIVFTFWNVGAGGGFTYIRAVPAPGPAAMLALAGLAGAARRRR